MEGLIRNFEERLMILEKLPKTPINAAKIYEVELSLLAVQELKEKQIKKRQKCLKKETKLISRL